MKIVSANTDAILVAINNQIYTNINEGNLVNQWKALQVLLHVWSYDFNDGLFHWITWRSSDKYTNSVFSLKSLVGKEIFTKVICGTEDIVFLFNPFH